MTAITSRLALLAACLAASATAASAQIRFPVVIPLGRDQPQAIAIEPGSPPPPAAMLQGSLIAASGSDAVYFSPRGTSVDANAAATLRAQARWLLANPFVAIRLEGHGGPSDTRDYAIAIGDRRANAVRDFLVLQGVAPERITVTSWGKERPSTILIGGLPVASGPRVVTKVR